MPDTIDWLKAESALLFLDGQLYFRHKDEDGQTSVKAVAHKDVRAAFSQMEIDSGWLHPAIRRIGENARGPWYISIWEPETHTLNLGQEVGEIKAPLPLMLFAGFGNIHYVWALPKQEIAADTRLLYAPLPNVYEDGHICWGQNSPPLAEPGNAEKIWRLFLSAEFNSSLVSGKSKAQDNDVRRQLINCAGLASYPTEDLVPSRNPLGWWVDGRIAERF